MEKFDSEQLTKFDKLEPKKDIASTIQGIENEREQEIQAE